MPTVRQLVAQFVQFHQDQIEVGIGTAATLALHRFHFKKAKHLWSKNATKVKRKHLLGTRHFMQSWERLYHWGHEHDVLRVNPIGTMKKPPPQQRHRVLNRTELGQLLRASRRPLRRFLFVQKRTMARPGELRQLRWNQIDLEKRVIVLTSYKAKDRRKDKKSVRVIPLDRVLCRWLANRKKNTKAGPFAVVLMNSQGKEWTKNALGLAFRRAAKRAGVNSGEGEPAVAYTIRHTAATTATRNGVRDKMLAEIMGHTSTKMTERYQHLEVADVLDVIDLATAKKKKLAVAVPYAGSGPTRAATKSAN